jgi:hypothetical protein
MRSIIWVHDRPSKRSGVRVRLPSDFLTIGEDFFLLSPSGGRRPNFLTTDGSAAEQLLGGGANGFEELGVIHGNPFAEDNEENEEAARAWFPIG